MDELTDSELELLDADAPAGLAVTFYLGALTHDELGLSLKWANKIMEVAPVFGGWIYGVLNREVFRRRAAEHYEHVREVEVIKLPFELSNSELADALGAVSTWTYAVENYRLGRLADRLFWAIVALVRHRLNERA